MPTTASLRGLLDYAAAGRRRNAARAALGRAFPDRPPAVRGAIVRRAFAWQAAERAAARAATRLPLETLCCRLHLDGWEHLHGVAPDRGLLFLSTPPVSAALALLPIALYRAPLLMPAGRAKHMLAKHLAPLTDLGSEHVEVVAEEVLEARLGQGAQAGLALTLHRPTTDAESVELPFLGGQTRVSNRIARLSLASGAPVIPLFTLPAERGRYAVTLTAPIAPPTDTTGPDAAAALTERYLAAVKAAIDLHPERWPWMEQAWLE